MKNILIVLDNIPKFNIEVSPKNKISDIKLTLENYFQKNQLSIDNYIFVFYMDSKNKMPVFLTKKYDQITLEKVFDSLIDPKIYITKKKEKKEKQIPFTGIKDVDLIILSNLNDEDLLNTCKIENKYMLNICNNEDFWHNRFIKNFGIDEKTKLEKTKERSWRNFYLAVLYYYKYTEEKILKEIAKGGMKNIDLINYFIMKGIDDWDSGMYGAAEGGDQYLVDFFIEKGGGYDRRGGMNYATRGGHLNLVKFFIGKEAGDWDEGMYFAAQGRHQDLVDFFIKKGAKNWDFGMYGAAEAGDQNLVNFFIKKGAKKWDEALIRSAKAGNQDLVNFFIKKLEDSLKKGKHHPDSIKFFMKRSWDYGLKSAAEGGHQNLIDFFIKKGADNWDLGMEGAAKGGNRELVDFFIEKGADNWSEALQAAEEGGHRNLINFFEQIEK